jgi:hypothetical protein
MFMKPFTKKRRRERNNISEICRTNKGKTKGVFSYEICRQ